jgi:hypothetical protein
LLLFGLITTENALSNFDLQKASIKDFTDILETYLQIYIKRTDDPETKAKLNEEVEKSYLLIQQIKTAIKNFNETNSIEFVRGCVEVYNDELKPLLNEILKLKYKQNMVVFEESSNTYHLVQRAYSIKDLEMNNDKYETIAFDTSVQPSGVKKRRLVLDSSSTESIDTSSTDTADIIGKPTIDEADGTVTWSNRNYQTLWNNMNNELKTALLSDTEWLQEFMDNCVKARLQRKSCEFINPSNLIIPPQLVEDGMYDFGNTVYNKIFNKFDESYKNTLLTLFSTNPEDGVKNYSMMENTLADIVKKELKFDRGNF